MAYLMSALSINCILICLSYFAARIYIIVLFSNFLLIAKDTQLFVNKQLLV